MHKQFQKFGFFGSKNINDEPQPKSEDNHVKYLYKKEPLDRKKTFKIASEEQKRQDDNKHNRRKKSSEVLRKRPTRNSNASGTEIFFIPPEAIRKHRKKGHHTEKNEKSPERAKRESCEEKKKRTKTEADIAKFVQKQQEKEDGHDWLTKQDVYKLITKSRDQKNNQPSSSFLKKLFQFDKEPPQKNNHASYIKKPHHYNEDRTSTSMKATANKNIDKGTKEKPVSVVYSRDSSRQKHHSEDNPKKKKQEMTSKLIFDELKLDVKEPRISKKTDQDVGKVKSVSIKHRTEEETKVKKKDLEARTEEKIKVNKELEPKVENCSRANPRRHKKCLVKNNFLLIDITPSQLQANDYLEYKKRLKAFKKYYKYSRTTDGESQFTNSTISHAFSDSHKMYQDKDEKSYENVKKHHGRKSSERYEYRDDDDEIKRRKKTKKSELKLETNVSSVVITPVEPVKRKEIKNKVPQKSRIPIFNNNKIVDLARDPSPKSKSRRQSANLFASKPTDEKKIHEEEKKNCKSAPKDRSYTNSERSSVDRSRPQSVPTKDKKQTQKEVKINKHFTSSIESKAIEKTKKILPSPQTYRKSDDVPSSACSRSSKKTRTPVSSKSDTRLEPKKEIKKKNNTIERTSTCTSRTNSTCGDKSVDSKNGTSFFLTKTYKDDEKLNRWQKRKEYADIVRKNAIGKSQKAGSLPPQVLEVRYLTNVTTPTEEPIKSKDFYENDLPDPCLELVEDNKFKELFELPTDKALNEVLNENYNFLKKDFSFNVDDLPKTEEDISSDDGKHPHDWYNFKMTDPVSLSEISCYRHNSGFTNPELNLGSQDRIVDSLSAPGSEESGYSTIKSRPVSTSFFERPGIKALFKPLPDSYVELKRSSSSNCGLEIRSIESKSLQTSNIDFSQKSVQIKLSQEEILEMISFSDQGGKADAEEEDAVVVEREQEEEEQLPKEKELNLEKELYVDTDPQVIITQTEQEETYELKTTEVESCSKWAVKKPNILNKIKRKLVSWSRISCFSVKNKTS